MMDRGKMTGRILKYCLPVLLVVFTLSGVHAQIGAFAEVDSNYAETGNPFIVHLKVVATSGKPQQTDYSTWRSVVPQENILKQTDWVSTGTAFTSDLTLVFFDEDTLTLPPLGIRMDNSAVLVTNTLEIVVIPTPSPDDLVDMSDIKEIRREPSIWLDYLPWALGIAGVILLVVLVSWLIGRAQKKRGMSSRSVELPPYELAIKKLEVLEQKQLWQKRQVKEFCAELTYILRGYLERRYRIPALESTSDEILRHLQATDFPEDIRSELGAILAAADLAKFAKLIPPESFHDDAWRLARNLLESTKPVNFPPPPVGQQQH